MFKPIAHDRGKVVLLPVTAAQDIVKFDLLKMASGYLVVAAAGDNEVEYIALQDSASAAVGTMIECLPIDETVRVEALCGTTPVQATHVGNDYDLADEDYIDLTATTDKVFHIDRIVSAADKIVEGHFNKPAIA